MLLIKLTILVFHSISFMSLPTFFFIVIIVIIAISNLVSSINKIKLIHLQFIFVVKNRILFSSIGKLYDKSNILYSLYTFACFSIALALKDLPHPSGHSNNSFDPVSGGISEGAATYYFCY